MKSFGWIALVLCAALLAPGCGSKDSKETPKKTGSDKGAATQEGGPLKIEVPGDAKSESGAKSEKPATPDKPDLKVPDEPKAPADAMPSPPDVSSAAPPAAAGGGKLTAALGKAFASGLAGDKQDK